jgi:hypothetical protein
MRCGGIVLIDDREIDFVNGTQDFTQQEDAAFPWSVTLSSIHNILMTSGVHVGSSC